MKSRTEKRDLWDGRRPEKLLRIPAPAATWGAAREHGIIEAFCRSLILADSRQVDRAQYA